MSDTDSSVEVEIVDNASEKLADAADTVASMLQDGAKLIRRAIENGANHKLSELSWLLTNELLQCNLYRRNGGYRLELFIAASVEEALDELPRVVRDRRLARGSG